MVRASRLIAITDPGDARIAPYAAIRERDLTGRGDRFIVEGKVTLDILATRSRFPVESVFIARHRIAAVSDILARLSPDIPIYTAPREVFDAIAGFPVHRGVLACARKTAPPAIAELARTPRLVAGFGISNHDNIGALFRNGGAFGASGVVLDATSGDPLYRKSIRVSAGSALWLPFVHGGSAQAVLASLRRSGHTIWALTPDPGAPSIYDLPIPDRLTLLVGAEGPGLPEDVLAATQTVRIPMQTGFDSINVATACAIALSHVFAC